LGLPLRLSRETFDELAGYSATGVSSTRTTPVALISLCYKRLSGNENLHLAEDWLAAFTLCIAFTDSGKTHTCSGADSGEYVF
jgi:hypothetical protein